MIYDSTMLSALCCGLNQLRGARLRDLWQGRAEDGNRAADSRALTLVFNDARHGDRALLIETDPQNARLHFLSRVPKTPDAPSALTDLLRKTLRGARFESAVQPNFERILHLHFTARDAIGEEAKYTLVAEMMERRSNAILLNENSVILDAIKRLPPFLNRARTILPHREYMPPPSRRANPLDVTDWQLRVLAALQNAATTGADAHNFDGALWLRDGFNGVSPLAAADLRATAARVLAAQNTDDKNAIVAAWSAAFDSFFARAAKVARGGYSPHLCEKSQPYPFALEGENCETTSFATARKSSGRENSDGDQKALDNALHFSALLEEAAGGSTKTNAVEEARAALLSQLKARTKLNSAQRNDVEKALQHAAAATRFNLEGQMILSHVAQVEDAAQRGESFVEVPDEYSQFAQESDGDAPLLRIEIEPKWSAADNAARCFARYRRAKKLGEGAPARLEKLAGEAAQIAQWESAARVAQTLEEIEKAARTGGAAPENSETKAASTRIDSESKPLSRPALSRSKREALAARPENKLRRRDIDDFVLFMGRNAIENQLLLSKVASPPDVWMHVRGRPSAHVIVKGPKGKTPPPQVLHEAGLWVASAGGRVPAGEKIEIIYTQAKFVRAVRGAPGRVTLGRFETLLVEARDEHDASS